MAPQQNRDATRDKHQAPTHPPIHPLSLRQTQQLLLDPSLKQREFSLLYSSFYKRYLKMLNGRYADTIQLGASTISLIFKSTAAPHRQYACSRVIE